MKTIDRANSISWFEVSRSGARAIVLLGLVSTALLAQTPDSAAIHGHILDQSRAAVPGVAVTVVSTVTSLKRVAQSDAQGDFTIGALPVDASYDITAAKEGFAPASLSGVTLQSGATAEIDLNLNVASGSTHITVTGVAGEVRADAAQLGDRIAGSQLEETPLPDNRITYLPLLNSANRPAINQGDIFTNQNLFTTNGAGRRQTGFEVDGGAGADSWGRQTIFTSVPLSAVAEMTVLTNSFSVEYGGSAGSAVNIVTRSGGNRLRGEIQEAWRPAATGAALSGFTSGNAANGNDVTSDTLGQTGISLGGPLGTDKRTHFFAAGEFTRENRASPVTSPIAPGSFVGRYAGWLGFFRLDRQIDARNTVFLRSGVDAFHDTNPNGIVGGNTLPSVDRVFHRRTFSEELGETALLGPSLVSNLRLQFQLASPITQFDPVVYSTQYQVPISAGGTFTTGTSQSALLMNRQYEMSDTVTAMRGRHTLDFGANIIMPRRGNLWVTAGVSGSSR